MKDLGRYVRSRSSEGTRTSTPMRRRSGCEVPGGTCTRRRTRGSVPRKAECTVEGKRVKIQTGPMTGFRRTFRNYTARDSEWTDDPSLHGVTIKK